MTYAFSHAVCRRPGRSVALGLRTSDRGNPDPETFAREHEAYVDALRGAGLLVTVLDPLEAFPDSVFVEDAALCVAGVAVILRPGAPNRFGERDAARAVLAGFFDTLIDLPEGGFVDGGDILITGREVLVGLSARTDAKGVEVLAPILRDLGLPLRTVETPPEILHFKSACGLIDDETVFCTGQLAAAGCFSDYRVIECPEGEEAAANLIRVNELVLVNAGYPRSTDVLAREGLEVMQIPTTAAAKLDGGLSCMSLRFQVQP